MKKQIYDFTDYKAYVQNWIEESPSKGRGLKLKIAEFLGCQTAFVSQVLNGAPNFSLEQAVKLNSFFHHGKDEGKFFLLLIQLGRAGSHELENFFKDQIADVLSSRTDLKNRIDTNKGLSKIDQQIYYSSWLYAAVHILISIKEFQTAEAIKKELNVPAYKISEVLEFLVAKGLVSWQSDHYEMGVTRIHLSKDSPQIQRHHTNWRMQAIRAIDINEPTDLHFSTVVSMSRADIPVVKEILIKAIEDCRKVIRDSKEEKIQSLCIDLFGL
jgi:uncharacterized protein (TIGR02147 family)